MNFNNSRDERSNPKDSTVSGETSTHVKIPQELLNRAINSLYAGAIGDALGARYEFDMENLLETDLRMYSDGNYDKSDNKELLPLLGGGVWALTEGQVTDDTEMAMAQASAILLNKDLSVLDGDIARAYHNWYLSDPFDIGKSTKNALGLLHKNASNLVLADEMKLAASSFNQKCLRDFKDPNLSNGMLMRIGPLAVFVAGILSSIPRDKLWSSTTTYDLIKEIVRLDTALTHSSLEALAYAVIYVTLIAFGILDGTLKYGLEFLNNFGNDLKNHGDAWLRLKNGLDMKPCKLAHDPTDRIGDVRIAFQLAIRKAMLVDRGLMNFPEALISTVKLQGDTDTNAAIVGYLVGSLLKGNEEIPEKWKNSLKNAVTLNQNKVQNQDKECKLRVIKHQPNAYLANLPELAMKLFNKGRNLHTR